jgi:hypothetical protein
MGARGARVVSAGLRRAVLLGEARCPGCDRSFQAGPVGHGFARQGPLSVAVRLRAFEHRCPHGEPCPGANATELLPCCAERARVRERLVASDAVSCGFVARAEALREEAQRMREEAIVAEKTCVKCGDPFEGHHRAKYCGDECKRAARAGTGAADEAPKKRRRARARSVADEPYGDGAVGPAELLRIAGYAVAEVRTPNGLALFVEEVGA